MKTKNALPRVYHVDQKITEAGNGVEISFTSAQYDKVLAWVLSRGYSAEPLEPEQLVKDWQWNVREMGKKVKK